MDYIKHMLAQDGAAQAQADYTQALMDPETPEQAAVRLRKARVFDMTPEETPTLTPEEEAVAKAQAINWATMYTEAPTLMEKLSEPAFANLVKDDISAMGIRERLIWAMAPDTGEKDSIWGTVRNSVTRGSFSGEATAFFGSVADKEAYAKELYRIQEIEEEIAQGKDVAYRFATAEDETGQVGLAAFLSGKDGMKARLTEAIDQASERTSRLTRYASFFPGAKATQEMMAQDSFSGAMSAFAKDPLMILADLGASSLAQNAPSLLALPVLGLAGTGAQIAGTFGLSYSMDKNASVLENLADAGIDLTDPKSIASAYLDPAKRDMLTDAVKRAEKHAAATALFDAASIGLAGVSMVPKSATRQMLDSAYKREFANMALQMPVQGAMGGMGEAAGQLLSDGEISSWADVVAEVVGEQFTAPVEVFTTGMKARAAIAREEERARRNAEAMKELSETQSAVDELDPETAAAYEQEVARRAGVEAIEFDANSFHQRGLDKKFSSVPEVAQQMSEALATGGTIKVPIGKVKAMAQEDESVLELMSVGGSLSIEEVKDVKGAVELQATQAAGKAFRDELSEVGRIVGNGIRALKVPKEEARNLQALIQTQVANIARQVNMSPKALWEKYGGKFVMGNGENGVNGEYFPSLRTVARWNGADRSTLLHETGHLFLDMRTQIAADVMQNKDMPDDMKAYVQSVNDTLAWLGVKDVQTWKAMKPEDQRAAHEKFARTFEAYMLDGEAPSQKLTLAFREYGRWLQDIYTVAENVPGAALNDDVKAMFDAMFVAKEDVMESMARQAAQPLFTAQDESGLSTEEWIAYQEAQQAVGAQAEAELTARNIRLQKVVKNMRNKLVRELKKERKGRIAEIRSQVEAEFKKTRVYHAWDSLVNGNEKDGKKIRWKLAFEDLRQVGYTPRQIKKLHEARIASPQSFRQPEKLEDIAQAFGYPNSNEMVDDLLANLDPEASIDAMTVERLVEESPELADESTMRDMADAATFNDAKIKVVSTELAAMEKALNGQARTESKAIDAFAYSVVQDMKIAGLKPASFARAASRAARNARKAWAKGAVAEAVAFKRQELYQTALAKHARQSLMRISKSVRGFKKYKVATHRAMDTRVLEVLQRALVNMGFVDAKDVHVNDPDASFYDKVKELENELEHGLEITSNMTRAIADRDTSALETIGGMNSFIDAIQLLEAQARREKHISTVMGNELLEDTLERAAKVVQETAVAHGRDAKKWHEQLGMSKRFAEMVERFGLVHARAAGIVATLEGGWEGLLAKLFIYPADKCVTKEEELKAKYAMKLDKILRPLKESLTDLKAKTSKTFNHAFTTQEVFVLLLNYGNEGNRQRALSTMTYHTDYKFFEGLDKSDPSYEAKLAEAQARADQLMAAFFAEYLTEEHYKAAEAVWALFDDIKESSGKTYRRIVGREPDWVEASAVRVLTPDGPRVLTGGYYPISYDREASLHGKEVGEIQSVEDLKPLMGAGGVADGWSKSRAKHFDKPLVMTSRAMFEGLDEQIHYIAWAEFVNSTRKLLKKEGAFAQAVHQHYGARYFKALEDWMKDCRNGNHGQTSPSDLIPNELRRGVSLAGVGLNFGTAALQLVGFTQSVAYLGPKWAGRGVSEFIRLGITGGAYKAVAGKSTMMRNRMRTQFRELTEVQAKLNGGQGELKDRMMRLAYMPLSVMQMAVDLPTWLGAYEKALAEGNGEEMSVMIADRAVKNSQGSGSLADLSAIERGSAWSKFFTVFYTFFNTALNLAAVSFKTEKGFRRAGTLLMVLVMQPVIEGFLRSAIGSALGEDDDDWLEKAVKASGSSVVSFNLGLLVVVRELAYLTTDYGYRGPSGLRKITDFGRAYNATVHAIENGEVSEADVKAWVSFGGTMAPYPVTPINRAISGANALYNDETDNPLALITGYSDKK